jgi:phosphate transport system permease protein
MKKSRKILERGTEGVLFMSSTVTTLTVLFIILFLFKEGIGIFNTTPFEKNNVLAVNPQNPVNHVNANQVKDIFNQDKTNWSQVGGANDSIILLTMDRLESFFTEEELGPDFEYLPAKLDSVIQSTSGVIAFIPENYVAKGFHGKIVKLENISPKEFFLGSNWFPTDAPAGQFGVLALILGTLWVSLGAIVLALPIGLITALYMAEVADSRIRNVLKPVIELLASIPSVVYGFFGLIVIVPAIQKLFNLPVGETALAGSIILAIMALPTIITISEDALRTTPRALKEASLALGASQWQTLRRITIPYSLSGITAASILGIGRAVGETMAVLMVTGNASLIPHSFLQPVRTIPATIAAELGEVPFGGVHYKALFALGIILFIITMFFNFIVDYVRNRQLKANK